MSNKKGDGKKTFSRAVKNEQVKKDKAVDVPEMVKQDRPTMELRPRGWDGLVDREIFDNRWNKQLEQSGQRSQPQSSRQLKTIKENNNKQPMINDFNLSSDGVGASEAHLSNVEDRLNKAIDEYFKLHEEGLPIPESLSKRVKSLSNETMKAENEHNGLKENGQKLKGNLKLGDVFDQITDRRNKRDQNRGRE